MTMQMTWMKNLLVGGTRVGVMSKCKALHTHMIKVLKQKEKMPNVPRCVGSGFHKNEGSPGVVVLFAGFSIYFITSVTDCT